MSSQRSRSRRPSSSSGSISSRINEEQINHLLTRIQALVPGTRVHASEDAASATRNLQEACRYIRSLHQEVDDLSQELSELLATANGSTS
ncbi:hypothetical protein KSP40_PGU009323 [Platanthera guangdongensis]|uniref:BHLH domain-containing protein n=1 Tax=Platanthera guangdongensis TaxID=2320717 RepID=A0ABR2LJ33_9ASPA